MRTTRLLTLLSIALLALATLSGCGDENPRSPVTPTPTPAPPSGPPPVTISRLELTGPTTVHVGEPAQFTVTAYSSDGSVRDLTGEVSWLTHSGILPMSAPGLFTGGEKGETALTARLGGHSAVMSSIVVVPRGTYRLTGTIRDAGIAVAANSVLVEDDALGHVSPSVINGVYKVYGVAGATRITVTKDGYETVSKQQTINSHQTVDFNLVLLRPRDEVWGRYTLTFTAAPECTALPEDLRARSYTVNVSQDGPRLEVTLEGGRFFSSGGRTHNRFGGILEAQVARFELQVTGFNYYHYFAYDLPDVFEELPGRVLFGIEGRSDAAVSGSSITGSFRGTIGTYSNPPSRSIARCLSTGHRLSLTR